MENTGAAATITAWVYTLHIGAYDARTLVGIFTTLDLVERELVRRVFRADRLDDVDIAVEGLDGAEVPEAVRTHLDAWVTERQGPWAR